MKSDDKLLYRMESNDNYRLANEKVYRIDNKVWKIGIIWISIINYD